MTVTAKGWNSSPDNPPTNANGRNTATVVMVDAVTAVATSLTPSRIATMRSSPSDKCRLMFSTTTIESSTTRPIEMVTAPIVRMLSEKLLAHIPMNVSNNDVGIDTAVTSVERIDNRKTRITMMAKISPRRPSTASDSMLFSMNGAWSKTMVNLVPLPSRSVSAGRAAVTARDTSTVFASARLVMARVSDGSPLTLEMEVIASGWIDTLASAPIVVTDSVVGAVVAPADANAERLDVDDGGAAGTAGTTVFTVSPATLPVMSATGTV